MELLTDEVIEEYVNDELIDSRPNPLGMIPIVPCPNLRIASSPWGLADIQEILVLNREFNEKATQLSDIINYHCVDSETEALTASGWKRYDEIIVGEELLTLDSDTDEIRWEPCEAVNLFDYDGPMVRWSNRVDALTTPNHRWLVEQRRGRARQYERGIARTTTPEDSDPSVAELTQGSRVILGGGVPVHFPATAKYDDEFVETIGWLITEGWVGPIGTSKRAGILAQSIRKNPAAVAELRRLATYWQRRGGKFTEQRERPNGVICWYLGVSVVNALFDVAPDKTLLASFLTSLTYRQAKRLYDILIDADGSRHRGREVWYQDDSGRRDGFQMLAAMVAGIRTRSFENVRGDGVVDIHRTRTIEAATTVNGAAEVSYQGVVWCPSTASGTWFARRNGRTYWTGNSEPVTVITGAKASNLEKGPNKVWAGLPKDAKITNLEANADLTGILAYMELLKRTMHELTGVPETALGQEQPVSNTSGVALSIMYLPLMFRYSRKVANYSLAFKHVNELIMLTLAVKEPQALIYDPTSGVPLNPENLPELDPADPLTYQSEIHWPPPLPMDVMLILQEETAKLQIGIQSKIGVLRALGEEQPEVKMREIFEERVEDLKDDAALQIMGAQVALMSAVLSGGVPTPEPENGPAGTGGGAPASQPQNPMEMLAAHDPAILGAQMDVQAQLFKELVSRTIGQTPNRALT